MLMLLNFKSTVYLKLIQSTATETIHENYHLMPCYVLLYMYVCVHTHLDTYTYLQHGPRCHVSHRPALCNAVSPGQVGLKNIIPKAGNIIPKASSRQHHPESIIPATSSRKHHPGNIIPKASSRQHRPESIIPATSSRNVHFLVLFFPVVLWSYIHPTLST
jgi:hypothetical protein